MNFFTLIFFISLCLSYGFRNLKYRALKSFKISCKNVSKQKKIILPKSVAKISKESNEKTSLFPSQNNDFNYYNILALVQLLPPLSIIFDATIDTPDFILRKFISYSYFITTATLSVYLGAKASDRKIFEEDALITTKNALLAPVFSSAILFAFYTLLKLNSFEYFFEKSYQFLSLLIGAFSIDTVISLAFVNNVNKDNQVLDLNDKRNNISVLTTGLIILGYLLITNFGGKTPEYFYINSFFSNLIALGIAIQSISLIKVQNFAVACTLLCGLFLYDIYFVFGTDIMMTVATKIEAPVKFLFPASVSTILDKPYPYSVLGLGDIVVPGIMAALARKIDIQSAEERRISSDANIKKENSLTRFLNSFINKKDQYIEPLEVLKSNDITYSYLNSSIVGYVFGLLAAFCANEFSHRGQPALLYLVPSVIISMLYTATKNEDLNDIWRKG